MKTTHKHHIVPKHMGGSDDHSNLIELTVEEHAEAHKVLYEQHGKWQDKIAWQMLSGQITNYEANHMALRLSNVNNKHFQGKTHTPEVRKIISEYQKVAKIGNKHRLGKTLTEESKEKIRNSLLGKKRGPYKKKGTQ
jgi:hypothetical protein